MTGNAMTTPAQMTPPTAAQIRQYTPNAIQPYVDALTHGWNEIAGQGITTPLRWCHFISEVAHECGDLTMLREHTGWDGATMKRLWPSRFPLGKADPRIIACRGDPEALANLAYKGRNGNTLADDGWHYRGGGFLQHTGRENYAEIAAAIGADLEGQPEIIEDPIIALRAALYYWTKNDLNRFADHNYGRAIGNAINRGNAFSKFEPNHARDRAMRFNRAWAIWGTGELPGLDELHLGASGPKVARIQGQLKDLGYGIGADDGVYGPTMARAVAAFKRDHREHMGVELEAGDVIGPDTVAALDTAQPIALSPERESATVSTLAAMGSTEIVAGRNMQNVGRGLMTLGAVGAADKTGALDVVSDFFQSITLLHSTAAPALRAISWAMGHVWWLALFAAAAWVWKSGNAVTLARLAAHRLGFNLFR